MSTAASPLPEPIDLLPETDPRFVQAVQDVALLGGGLMQVAEAGLIAAPFVPDATGTRSIMLWNENLAHCPEGERLIRTTRAAAPALDALALAVEDLRTRLEDWRWNGLETSYGVITDGDAVAMLRSAPDRIGGLADCAWWADAAVIPCFAERFQPG